MSSAVKFNKIQNQWLLGSESSLLLLYVLSFIRSKNGAILRCGSKHWSLVTIFVLFLNNQYSLRKVIRINIIECD